MHQPLASLSTGFPDDAARPSADLHHVAFAAERWRRSSLCSAIASSKLGLGIHPHYINYTPLINHHHNHHFHERRKTVLGRHIRFGRSFSSRRVAASRDRRTQMWIQIHQHADKTNLINRFSDFDCVTTCHPNTVGTPQPFPSPTTPTPFPNRSRNRNANRDRPPHRQSLERKWRSGIPTWVCWARGMALAMECFRE